MHNFLSNNRKHKSKSVWKRKTSDITTSFYPTFDPDFDQTTLTHLKSVTKKAAIISRLEAKANPNKQLTKARNLTHNNTVLDERRPATTVPSNRINSLRTAQQAYRQEKSINQRMLSDPDMS